MIDLSTIFGSLEGYHVATRQQPLPEAKPGILWIWAANGIFKRGIDAHLDILIQVEAWEPGSYGRGLTSLLPSVRWSGGRTAIPGAFLGPILQHAQHAGDGETIVRPIEQHYLIVRDPRRRQLRVIVPPQQATAGSVRYAIPDDTEVLMDLHSHHSMAAYFSSTDDRDDSGLSVSAVIGNIFTQPEIVTRLNVYGHRQEVSPTTIFDDLGALRSAPAALRRAYADAHY